MMRRPPVLPAPLPLCLQDRRRLRGRLRATPLPRSMTLAPVVLTAEHLPLPDAAQPSVVEKREDPILAALRRMQVDGLAWGGLPPPLPLPAPTPVPVPALTGDRSDGEALAGADVPRPAPPAVCPAPQEVSGQAGIAQEAQAQAQTVVPHQALQTHQASPTTGPRVLFVCAEVYPLLKTGGLADVCAALPTALAALGADVRLLLPAFPAIAAGVTPNGPRWPLPLGHSRQGAPLGPQTVALPAWVPTAAAQPLLDDGGEAPATAATASPPLPWVQRGTLSHNGATVYLLHAPALFARQGHPYVDAQGHTWADAPLQFAWLGWAAAALGLGHDPDWCPEVVHGHDWHSGLAAAYLHLLPTPLGQHRPTTVFTIHNLAYQGVFDARWCGPLGIPDALFHMNGLEFHGQLSFIKGGLCYSDHLTTVSPRYAQEITQTEQGCGLDGVLRHRQDRLQGILNAVDETVWHPAHDPHVQPGYNRHHLLGKALAKARLQAELGLETRPNALLCVVVSRLTEQKGLHLLPQVMDELVQRGGQLAVLGAGDTAIESALAACVQRHPAQVALRLGYDEALAHRLIAGGDVILVPSRFEPCGLTQLYGLRYGTLPLVRAVGGLADTVTDCTLEHIASGAATGFVFHSLDAHDLLCALRRALALWQRPADWQAVQRQAMAQAHDWSHAAQTYMHLYHRARR